jgi:hypothetical protein
LKELLIYLRNFLRNLFKHNTEMMEWKKLLKVTKKIFKKPKTLSKKNFQITLFNKTVSITAIILITTVVWFLNNQPKLIKFKIIKIIIPIQKEKIKVFLKVCKILWLVKWNFNNKKCKLISFHMEKAALWNSWPPILILTIPIFQPKILIKKVLKLLILNNDY